MYCPHCGTKTTGEQRFCGACGGEISATAPPHDHDAAPRLAGGLWSAPFSAAPPLGYPYIVTHVIVRERRPWRLLLLLLLSPLLAIALLTGLALSVVLVGAAIKVAPLIAIGLLVWWLLTHERRGERTG